MNNSSNWWHSNASNSFENSQLDLSKSFRLSSYFFFSLLQILDWHILMDVFFFFFDRLRNVKMCKSVKKEKETLEKEKSPPTCLRFALVPLSLRSPHCDDLWFTFVNKLLLCVTFCFYSSLAYRLVILDVLSLRGQLHSDLPVRLNKSWQNIFLQYISWKYPGYNPF